MDMCMQGREKREQAGGGWLARQPWIAARRCRTQGGAALRACKDG